VGPQGLSELCKICGTYNNNFHYCLSSKLISKDSSVSIGISICSSSSSSSSSSSCCCCCCCCSLAAAGIIVAVVLFV
jgi:hypothetical protein